MSKIIYLISCGVLGPEFRHVAKELSLDLRTKFLPGRLHNNPQKLNNYLQKAIDDASADPQCERIVIGYGLCGRGTVGIRCSGPPLVFPKVHDCIALFLGGNLLYQEQFDKYPGTYYITEGWHDERQDALSSQGNSIWVGTESIGSNELHKKYGNTNAKKIVDFFSSWKSNYQRAVYIDTGIKERTASIASAKAMASENDWQFENIQGDLYFIRKLFAATTSDNDILLVPSGYKTIHSADQNCLACAPFTENDEEKQTPSRQIKLNNTCQVRSEEEPLGFGFGIDAGGTYTDGVIYDFTAQNVVAKHKSLTTKWDFSVGIQNCLAGLPSRLLTKIDLVSVSTTLATNAIVEGEGQLTGLLLMGGENITPFENINHNPRALLHGRLSITGKEMEKVDESQVLRVVRKMILDNHVSAFAVSGFAGSINPAHELQVKRIVEEETGMSVCCGHELSTNLNLVTRAQTALVNARIIPKILRFLSDLDKVLHTHSIAAPTLMVKGDGTLFSTEIAKTKPVETILSGPAASVAGARHLCGLRDCMVVDIGGTTTDSGDIEAGAVSLCEKGAVVGGIETHVEALSMRTIGFGGDSHIHFRNGQFTIGPKRVAPLVWAHDLDAVGTLEALDTISKKPLHRQQQIILITTDSKDSHQLSEEEQELFTLIHNRPVTLESLVAQLNRLSPPMNALNTLEEHGLIQRCGLTPTDLFHIQGSFQRWDPHPAHRIIEIFAKFLHKPSSQIVSGLLNTLTELLAEELVNCSVFKDFSDKADRESELFKYIVKGLTHPKKRRYRLKAELEHPIVGIGAPAACLLPGAGRILDAEIVIPENADVANAVGAITSHISLRQTVSIQPDSSGRYSVTGVQGVPSFETLARAEKWVLNYLQEKLLSDAKKAGTLEETVDVYINDSTSTLSDGSTLFLERSISAHLKGAPNPSALHIGDEM